MPNHLGHVLLKTLKADISTNYDQLWVKAI